jgi:hypothetical protein
MSALDLIAGFLFGIYMLAVAWHGNAKTLLSYAERDVRFLLWIVAIAVLYKLYRVPGLAPIAGALIAMVFIELAINKTPIIMQNAQSIWASITKASTNLPATATT